MVEAYQLPKKDFWTCFTLIEKGDNEKMNKI